MCCSGNKYLFTLFHYLLLAETYPTAERLAQSLKEGEVDYILVDMYLPVKRRDLFNGSWFEIVSLLKTEVFHGVILQGDALKLASTLEAMIANNNVQTKFLADSDTEEVTPFLQLLTERIYATPPTSTPPRDRFIAFVFLSREHSYRSVSLYNVGTSNSGTFPPFLEVKEIFQPESPAEGTQWNIRFCMGSMTRKCPEA